MRTSEDPFAAAASDLKRRIEEHEETRSTERYQAAEVHLQRLIQDFASALHASWFAFTRYPESKNWLLQNSADDLLESAIALPLLARDGVFNVARRELRYVLEASVKFVYVDQQVPADSPLEDRMRFLGDTTKVPRSSIAPIADTTIRMLQDPDQLRRAVKQSFGALSGYVHPSKKASQERMRHAQRGEFSGFEGPATLEAFTRLASQTLDLVLVMIFEGIGPAFTGDLFIQLFDERPEWKFHRTKFAKQVSAHFDYKLERQRE
jgi:hypothetical protein